MSYRITAMLTLSVALLSACSNTTESFIVRGDNGRVIRETDKATGTVTEWEYSPQGRFKTIKSQEGSERHYFKDTCRQPNTFFRKYIIFKVLQTMK